MSEDTYDAEEYFDLLVECAKKLMEQKPVGQHPSAYWRELVGREWRNVYQHMTRPDERFGMWKSTAYRRELGNRFAALSRMSAMAAWWIGVQQEDGEDRPQAVAREFTRMGEQMTPKIR